MIDPIPPLDQDTLVVARFLRGLAVGAYAAGAMILPMITLWLFRILCSLSGMVATTKHTKP